MSLIESILTAITDLPSEDRKTLIDRMHTEMVEKVNAKAADEAKRARIDRLNAAKADASTRSNIVLLEGLLRRGGVSLDDVVAGDIAAIDKMFAQSKLTISDRLSAKALLHRYGCL